MFINFLKDRNILNPYNLVYFYRNFIIIHITLIIICTLFSNLYVFQIIDNDCLVKGGIVFIKRTIKLIYL